MIRRRAWTRPYAGSRSGVGDIAIRLSDLLIITDVIAGTILGYVAANIQRSGFGDKGGVWSDLILSSVIIALITSRQNCVTSHMRILTLLTRTGRGYVYATAILTADRWMTRGLPDLSGAWVMLWAVPLLGWLCASRLFVLSYLRLANHGRGNRESVAIIGEGAAIDRLLGKIEAETNVVMVFRRRAADSLGIGAALAHIAALAREGAVGLVVLAMDTGGRKDVAEAVLRHLKAVPVRVALCLDSRRPGAAAASPDMIAGVPITVLATRPLSTRDLFVKSLVDKIGTLVLLVLVSPLLLAISLAVYLDTPGPILFRQARSGWCGRLFTVYKFRTMHPPGGSDRSGQTVRADPRCTRVGAFLRRTSLDELPQLWNVLRGEMSLVGPRPHADFLHAGQRSDPFLVTEYLRRQRVKPGLTGWAQVHGYRGAADTPEKLRRRIELDLYYIEHWSLWLDIRIIAKTPWVVVSAENAF